MTFVVQSEMSPTTIGWIAMTCILKNTHAQTRDALTFHLTPSEVKISLCLILQFMTK